MGGPQVSAAKDSGVISIDPEHEEPTSIYKMMIGAIVPRPIALVSSTDAEGVRNLAPFSFFAGVCSKPPTILFCPGIRATTRLSKDTLRNVLETKEFVVNIVDEAMATRMNKTSAEVPPQVDEFKLSGLTPVASLVVTPPRVSESPVQMECKLRDVVTISDQPGGGSVVIGEVVRFHLRADLIDNFRIDADALKAIGRMGGPTYCRTADRFDMERPR
jgi:flavin reductase (DIM6/NTAB) family NADH-FMN oxidoreductase RutF